MHISLCMLSIFKLLHHHLIFRSFFAVLKYWHSTAMSLHYPCNNCTITVLPLHSTPTSRSKPQQQHQQHVTMPILTLTSKSASSTPISKPSYTQTDIYTNIYKSIIQAKIYSNIYQSLNCHCNLHTEISAQRFKSSL